MRDKKQLKAARQKALRAQPVALLGAYDLSNEQSLASFTGAQEIIGGAEA